MALDFLRGKKAVVTWSGGLDSTSLIPFMMEQYDLEVFPIFINRKQKNYKAEAKAIKYFTQFFSKKYGSLFHKPFEVKTIIPPLEFKKHFPQADVEKTHALRNSDIVNHATRYALILEIDFILTGSNIKDQFKDNSPSYWRKKTDEIRDGTGNDKLQVIAPFQELRWDKKDMILWCHNNGIPIEKSWSCWESLDRHCGICPPCKRRKDAFSEAHVKDTTLYLE
ncbi:MAG: 7-cyano-7-deazaguanine synthase [Candidatus Jordarchaeaceae archaeon]